MKTIKDKKIVQPPFLHQDNKVAFVSPAYWLSGETIQDAFFIPSYLIKYKN
jgi:membrane protein CcdC involved in cytochrome C biogenesis